MVLSNYVGWTPRALLTRVRHSTVATNVIWNYAGVIWLACLNILTLPVYLRLLGRTDWGLVAVCMTLQNALALLDVGFGQIMPKTIAQAHGDRPRLGRTLGAYLRIYLVLGLLGFAGGQFLAGPLARNWFHAPQIAPSKLELALRLVLVQFLFQFTNNVHVGYWNGMQLQRTANLRQAVFTTLRHAVALLSVYFVAHNAFGYLLPFVIITCLEWAANRRWVLRDAGYGFWSGPRVERQDVIAIVREARAFTVGILLGLLVTQLDRLVLTKTQDIAQYGTYVIVANVALAFLNLQYPLLRAFFPKIVRERVVGAADRSRALRQLLIALSILCVAPSLAMAAVAPQVLLLWLRSPGVAAAGALPLRLILAAVALNAMYNVIYQRILVEGRGRVVIGINLASLAASFASVWIFGPGIGIVLGGIMWLASASTQLVLGGLWALLQAQSLRAGAAGT